MKLAARVRLAAAAMGLALAASLSSGCSGCSKTADSAPPDGAAASAADAGLAAESKSMPPAAASAVAQYLNPQNYPAYDGPTGILQGHVYVRGPAAPNLDAPARSTCKNVSDYRLFRDGAPDPSGRRPLADAVVGVTGYHDTFVPPRTDAVAVRVKDCAFEQRTIVLTFGQRLDITNAEALNSGVFYAPQLTKDSASSLMIAAPGNTVKLYFARPGRDLLVDGMGHNHLYADVFAAVHSLHVVTDAAGHFILPGIPVGELDASAMHPAFDSGGVTQKLVFKAGETTHHDFELTYVPASRPDAGAPKADAGAKTSTLH